MVASGSHPTPTIGVYKFNRLKGAQRRILQLDFQTEVMCNVQRGHRNNQFRFDQIERIESEDGVHFTIHFEGDARPPYEYEADSLEEKNKIFRLLSLIVNKNRSSRMNQKVRWGVPASARDDGGALQAGHKANGNCTPLPRSTLFFLSFAGARGRRQGAEHPRGPGGKEGPLHGVLQLGHPAPGRPPR